MWKLESPEEAVGRSQTDATTGVSEHPVKGEEKLFKERGPLLSGNGHFSKTLPEIMKQIANICNKGMGSAEEIFRQNAKNDNCLFLLTEYYKVRIKKDELQLELFNFQAECRRNTNKQDFLTLKIFLPIFRLSKEKVRGVIYRLSQQRSLPRTSGQKPCQQNNRAFQRILLSFPPLHAQEKDLL